MEENFCKQKFSPELNKNSYPLCSQKNYEHVGFLEIGIKNFFMPLNSLEVNCGHTGLPLIL